MLHYKKYELSETAEWVTVIHGAGGSSSIWFKQIKAFKEHFNVLLIDLRGHGNSKGVKLKELKKYTFNNVSQDIKQVLDHLDIKSHFVGISLGSIIIRELAEICPERVSSMIMGGAILKMNFRSQLLMKVGFWFKSLIPYILLYKLFAFVIMPKRSHKESRNLFVREAKKLYQKEFIRWFGLTTTVNPILRLFRSKDPEIPTLYVMGEQDYMFLPPVEMTAKKHDSAELLVIKDCGHVVNVEKPLIFNELVVKWLSQLETKKIPAVC